MIAKSYFSWSVSSSTLSAAGEQLVTVLTELREGGGSQEQEKLFVQSLFLKQSLLGFEFCNGEAS